MTDADFSRFRAHIHLEPYTSLRRFLEDSETGATVSLCLGLCSGLALAFIIFWIT